MISRNYQVNVVQLLYCVHSGTATFYECHTIGIACFNHEIYNQIPPWLMVNDGIPDRYFCNFYCNNDVFKLYKSEA